MLLQLMNRLEYAEVLDPAVRTAEPLAARLIADARLRRFFHGDATGIPPHAILTDVPFGAWFMAMFLDLFPDEGSRRAARRLGLGVLAAAPTGLSGWAEWARADTATRRVGIVHAAANLTATLIFLASWHPGAPDARTGTGWASAWPGPAPSCWWSADSWAVTCAASSAPDRSSRRFGGSGCDPPAGLAVPDVILPQVWLFRT